MSKLLCHLWDTVEWWIDHLKTSLFFFFFFFIFALVVNSAQICELQCKKAWVDQMLRAVLELPAAVHIQNFNLHLIVYHTSVSVSSTLNFSY